MLVATFNQSSGWFGKTITWEDGVFTLEGRGTVTPKSVMDYDAGGLLEWAPGGMRGWVDALADGVPAGPPTPVPAPAPTVVHVYSAEASRLPASAVGPVRVVATKQRMPRWAVLAIVAVAVAIAVVAGLVILDRAATPSDGQRADGESSVSQPSTAAGEEAGTWVQVASWTGGGPGLDSRASEPFTLEGGHQRASIVTKQVAGTEPGMGPGGWTLEPEGGGSSVELDPPDFGTWEPDFYRPAGRYHLSSQTFDCTWTITISELR